MRALHVLSAWPADAAAGCLHKCLHRRRRRRRRPPLIAIAAAAPRGIGRHTSWATARLHGSSGGGLCTSCRLCGWRRCVARQPAPARAAATCSAAAQPVQQPPHVAPTLQARKYVPPELPLVSLFGWTLGGFYLARYSGEAVRMCGWCPCLQRASEAAHNATSAPACRLARGRL